MKVLIVEDNPANMKLVADLLRGDGHDVLQAEDGNAAVRLAREERPDLILMDIQLPGMDGLTATRAIKRDPATAHIPVIALTAFVMKEDDRLARDAGCIDVITKPIQYRKLLQIVRSYARSEERPASEREH